MKIFKKLLTVIMLVVLICMTSACGVLEALEFRRIEKNLKERVGEALELNLTDSKMIDYWNNQGWMGDGNYLATFTLSKGAISQLYDIIREQEPKYKPDATACWHALPFPSALYEDVYSVRHPFMDTRGEDSNALPYVKNGYWWSTAYHAEFDGSYTASDFEFSLFDADMGRLYFYAHYM